MSGTGMLVFPFLLPQRSAGRRVPAWTLSLSCCAHLSNALVFVAVHDAGWASRPDGSSQG
eukprot:10787053-Lingulodinium_polyedra.AAC.1